MVGTYTYIVGVFGFVFVMITFIIAGEIFDVFEIWVAVGAIGFDADIWAFFQGFWTWLPVLFLMSFGLWGFNELQKRGQFE